MLLKEFFIERNDGVKLYRTYSNIGYKIRQIETGIEYDEAIDVENSIYSYEETNNLIETMEENIDNE